MFPSSMMIARRGCQCGSTHSAEILRYLSREPGAATDRWPSESGCVAQRTDGKVHDMLRRVGWATHVIGSRAAFRHSRY
jgi:hypothetical protein